jgi:hypothetical protein
MKARTALKMLVALAGGLAPVIVPPAVSGPQTTPPPTVTVYKNPT